jgi:hypothetical protein
LHCAALALVAQRPGEALAWVRQALAHDPTLAAVDDRAALVHAALPGLTRLARAAALAEAVRFAPDQPAAAPGLLVDLVDLLDAEAQGRAALDAAERGDGAAARQALSALAGRSDLPPRLAHHLALVHHRAALFLSSHHETPAAEACFRLAWPCWLRTVTDEDAGRRDVLLAHLLDVHRRAIGALLARAAVDNARRHWSLVHELPGLASAGPELADQVARFGDKLATDYLVATREAMRHGAAPEGLRADYERGLARLRLLLSLDRDNLRLLTALLEVCADWFIDLYHAHDEEGLHRQVERFTPFALQLARLVEGRTAELAARAAVAEFYKFRGFVTPGQERKVALYREAVRFNPANDNARELLAQCEGCE